MVRYQGVKKLNSARKSKKLKRAPKAIDEIYDEITQPRTEEVRQRTIVKPLDESLPGALWVQRVTSGQRTRVCRVARCATSHRGFRPAG